MDGGSWHCIVGRDQDHPQEKEMQKDKMVVQGGLKNSWEKKKKLKAKEKRYTHLNAEFQRIAGRDKKAFLSDQCKKKIEKNSRMWKTRDLFKKIRDSKGIFHAKMGTVKDRNCMDLTGEGNDTRLQYSCLENPMDGGAWKAAVHGVTKNQTRLSDWTTKWLNTHCLETRVWKSKVGNLVKPDFHEPA